jgi:hypothetical protein
MNESFVDRAVKHFNKMVVSGGIEHGTTSGLSFDFPGGRQSSLCSKL